MATVGQVRSRLEELEVAAFGQIVLDLRHFKVTSLLDVIPFVER